MHKLFTAILCCLSMLVATAQVQKSSPQDSLVKAGARLMADSATQKAVQDTVVKESRKVRKAREKAEAEHEKYYYNDIKKDSTRLHIEELSRNAWRRSLILPGWGQYTNKGLWWIKVPVIYGGFVTSYFVFDYWQWNYKKLINELDYRFSNAGDRLDPDLIYWEEPGLIDYKDYARRNRDLTIIVTAGWWGLQVVESYVNSMLKNRWDIGNALSVKVSPTFMQSNGYSQATTFDRYGITPGVKLTMQLK